MTHFERACGDCAACCKTHEIVEIAKPEGAWCPHVENHKRCSIYETRPPSCRTFACSWLRGSGALDERPDKVRIVPTSFSFEYRGKIVHWCTMTEVSVGALDRPYPKALAEKLHKLGWVVEQFTVDHQQQRLLPPSGYTATDVDNMLKSFETMTSADRILPPPFTSR